MLVHEHTAFTVSICIRMRCLLYVKLELDCAAQCVMFCKEMYSLSASKLQFLTWYVEIQETQLV